MNNESLGYFCVGAAVGVAAAVLLTPKSGSETREYVTSQANSGLDYVKARAEDVRTAAADVVQKGKQAVKTQADGVGAAVDAGKQAYRESLMTQPQS
jgi:gas vesicle protein